MKRLGKAGFPQSLRYDRGTFSQRLCEMSIFSNGGETEMGEVNTPNGLHMKNIMLLHPLPNKFSGINSSATRKITRQMFWHLSKV